MRLKHFLYIIPVILITYFLYINLLQAVIYKITHRLNVKDFWNYVYIYKEIFIDKDYAAILPKPGDVVFDVGGNQGLYSLYLNDKCKNINIHTFEPIPDLFEQLEHNVNSNVRKTNNIIANNFGLSDRDEELMINYFPNASGLSTIADDMEEKEQTMIESKCSNSLVPGVCKLFMQKVFIPKLNKNRLKQPIKLTSMSSYIDKNNVTKIDIVKIDVEGHELQVLKGIRDEHFQIIGSFMIEVENYRPGYLQEILYILNRHNYNIKVKDAEKQWCMVVATK